MLDRVTPFVAPVMNAAGPPADLPRPVDCPRARHALMLDYAGRRRRAAQRGLDGPYWKAMHPAALDRARDLRRATGFGRLP